MIFLLWISFIAALLNVSVSQSPDPVESCISFSSSEEALLNINWSKDNVNLSIHRVSIRYQAAGDNVLKVISCFEEENVTGIDLFGDTADQSVEVSTTALDTCDNNSLPQNAIGSATAEFGYISDVDTVLSEDNSSIIVTCSLACQTDFITGCSVTLSGCGEESTLSCTVDGSVAFRPRQCSVEFQNLFPTSYIYTANAMADVNMPLMREENVLSISGSFTTSDSNNFSCEQPTSGPNITTTNTTVPNDDGSNTGGNSSNPSNTNGNDNSTMTNVSDDNNNPNDTSNNNDDNTSSTNLATDSPSTPVLSPSPSNEDPSNSTQGRDDEGILEKIESLPVPVIASIGAVILILIIVVTILLIVCCKMKSSSNQDKSKKHGAESGTDCASFTFQNSTQLLFEGHADSCSEVRSNNQSVITASSSVDQLPSYDHLEKSYQTKESSPTSQGSSSRNSAVNNHMQNRDSSVSALDDELLDDFDYDEIEEPTNTSTSTQYNNLVHSGKEQRLKIDNPPAPSSTGTYERLSQPPADDNYAVPPEIDDFEPNEVRKSMHEYEVPPDVNQSPNSEDHSNIPQTNITYDHLSPKLCNIYDRVGSGFQYDYRTNNTLSTPRKNQYDTLLPKVPVVGEISKPDSSIVTQQPSPSKVQHSPGPLTGDMYTVPKKFEIKSSSFHDYDTVADAFDGQSTMF